MTKKAENTKIDTGGWAFAVVNNKLSEIFFKVKNNKVVVYAHCYVNEEEYKTKQEQKMIRDDIAKYKFTWKKGEYKQIPEVKTKKLKV